MAIPSFSCNLFPKDHASGFPLPLFSSRPAAQKQVCLGAMGGVTGGVHVSTVRITNHMGNNGRRRFSAAGARLYIIMLNISMLHINLIPFRAQPLIDTIGDKHRTVQAPGAPNRDNKLAFAFFHIIRH